jgi:hypothetical protein
MSPIPLYRDAHDEHAAQNEKLKKMQLFKLKKREFLPLFTFCLSSCNIVADLSRVRASSSVFGAAGNASVPSLRRSRGGG